MSVQVRLCAADGCERDHFARGYCSAHYQQWRIHGTVQPGPLRPYTHWTPRKRVVLDDLLARGQSDEQIAEHFGTTTEAVKSARQRYGIAARYRQGHTVAVVARLMGVGSKRVLRWIRDGRLRASKNGARWACNRVWQIRDAALTEFVDNPEHWHCWEVDAITDDDLRRYAARVRGDVRFLMIGEIAYAAGTTHEAVWQAIQRGALPSRQDGRLHYIPEADGRRWIHMRRPRRHRYTAADDRCIRELRRRGLTWDVVGAAIGVSGPAARMRYERVQRKRKRPLGKRRRLYTAREDALIDMRRRDEWSWECIGALLNRSPRAVESRYHRLKANGMIE